MYLSVRVTANSRRPGVVSFDGKVLGVKVSAPPADGKANEALCELVSTILHIPKTVVRLARGGSSRLKVLEIVGIDESRVFATIRRHFS